MIVHVDDFLCTYHQDFDAGILKDMFVWGSVTIVEPDSSGTYRGKEILKVRRGDKFVFKVTQEAFIEGLTSGSVPRGRSKTDEKLSASEWKEFRSLAGSIQWLASQTRPEVAAVVSLSNRGGETSVTDLKRPVRDRRLPQGDEDQWPDLPGHPCEPGVNDRDLRGLFVGECQPEEPVRAFGFAVSTTSFRATGSSNFVGLEKLKEHKSMPLYVGG